MSTTADRATKLQTLRAIRQRSCYQTLRSMLGFCTFLLIAGAWIYAAVMLFPVLRYMANVPHGPVPYALLGLGVGIVLVGTIVPYAAWQAAILIVDLVDLHIDARAHPPATGDEISTSSQP
jgi:hypothetical protein